jgi:hypothetical protein
MLKIYTHKHWVSIDHEEWEQVWWDVDVMKDDSFPNEVILVEQMSFDKFYNILQVQPMAHIRAGKTFFRKKPKISIDYDFDHTKHYTHFDTISYKITYEEVKGTTLYNIMRVFPAEQTIQYLKERGITTCPMNF